MKVHCRSFYKWKIRLQFLFHIRLVVRLIKNIRNIVRWERPIQKARSKLGLCWEFLNHTDWSLSPRKK
jgi:hypothetical protein